MTPFFRRLKFAFSTFFAILFKDHLPAEVVAALVPTPASHPDRRTEPVAPAAVDEQGRAAQLLAILQRDGRILDFVMEDISPYADAQIGAAARDVHAGCRRALDRYMTLTSVIEGEEGSAFTVEPGTDAASVKVIGNAAGDPPFRGVIRHRGWRATRIDLPPLALAGRMVIAPAEIEVP